MLELEDLDEKWDALPEPLADAVADVADALGRADDWLSCQG